MQGSKLKHPTTKQMNWPEINCLIALNYLIMRFEHEGSLQFFFIHNG